MSEWLWLDLLIIAIIAGFAYAGSKGAPWVPTRKKELDYLLKNIDIPNNALIYDLGSGDGRAVFYFAANENVKKAIGYELAWPLYLFCTVKKIFKNKKISEKIDFELENFFKANIAEADIVFCFLMPKVIEKVIEKVFSQMKPGAQLISAVFSADNMQPNKVIKKSSTDCAYYLYVK